MKSQGYQVQDFILICLLKQDFKKSFVSGSGITKDSSVSMTQSLSKCRNWHKTDNEQGTIDFYYDLGR